MNENETAKPDTVETTETSTDEAPIEQATKPTRPRPRGFAAIPRDRRREISSKGGKAAHKAGTAHRFTPEEARKAGRKGGVAPHISRGGPRRTPKPTGSSD